MRPLPFLRPSAGHQGRAVIFLGLATFEAPELPDAELPSVHLKVDAVARSTLEERFAEPDDLAELHLAVVEAVAGAAIELRLLDRAGNCLSWRRSVPLARLAVERDHITAFVKRAADRQGAVFIVSQIDVPGAGPEAHPQSFYLAAHQVHVSAYWHLE